MIKTAFQFKSLEVSNKLKTVNLGVTDNELVREFIFFKNKFRF